MKILLDTSVVIPIEPTSAEDVEGTTEIIALMQRRAQQLGAQLFVHPSSREELSRDRDPERRATRAKLVLRYLELPFPPPITPKLEFHVGHAEPGSHDEVDHNLLAAIQADAVDLLATLDKALLSKAAQAGLDDRVLTPTAALRKLEEMLPREPRPRPVVRHGTAYEIREDEPVLAEVRDEYGRFGFEDWFRKCKLEHRDAWLIERGDRSLGGLVIVKRESPGEYGLPGKILKICTLVTSPHDFGRGYGELLLKAVFDYAFDNAFNSIFLEVFSRHGDVVSTVSKFGFAAVDRRSTKGELVLAKSLNPTDSDRASMAPLALHVKYGPPRLKVDGARVFVVPIRPHYHAALFPETEMQGSLLSGFQPFGNAILKAYLCHSSLAAVPPGSVLLFYRSMRRQGVHCVGVVESFMRSRDAEALLRFVGTRTVYTCEDVDRMARREVLAILFRHAVTLDSPWDLRQLLEARILRAAPQSIAEVPREAVPWLSAALKKWL